MSSPDPWRSADPAAVPEFYAPPKPPALGDPALDPPMTVRVESWEDRMKPDVRRVIKRAPAAILVNPTYPWVLISGSYSVQGVYTDAAVASWTPVHPLTYRCAFRHLQAEDARYATAEIAEIAGDMDVDAFKGGHAVRDDERSTS